MLLLLNLFLFFYFWCYEKWKHFYFQIFHFYICKYKQFCIDVMLWNSADSFLISNISELLRIFYTQDYICKLYIFKTRNSSISLILIWLFLSFIFMFYIIALARTFSTILDETVKSKYPCLVFVFNKTYWGFFIIKCDIENVFLS